LADRADRTYFLADTTTMAGATIIKPNALLESKSVADLMKQLKELKQKLSDLDQENVDLATLDAARVQLISPRLVQHKDKGVRIITACCLADLLRRTAI
jgi:hypothetical protein